MSHPQENGIKLSRSALTWLLSSHITGLSACIALFILTIYRFYYSKANRSKKTKTKNHIQIVSILNILCYILFYTSNILSDYLYFKFLQNNDITLDAVYYICIILAILSASLAPLLFFILMIIRLYTTFYGTIYHTETWVFRLYSIGNILMGLVWIIAWISDITPILNYDYDLLEVSNFTWVGALDYIIGSILVIMNILFGTSLTYLFISKLFRLIVAQQQSLDFKLDLNNNNYNLDSPSSIHSPTYSPISSQLSSVAINPPPLPIKRASNSPNASRDSNTKSMTHSRMSSYGFSLPYIPAAASVKNVNAEFNPKQLRLLRTITKHTILAATAISFYQLALVFGVLQKFLIKGDGWDRIAAYYLFTIATIVEILCIFLSFKVNHKCYLVLCRGCHRCVEKCCHTLAYKSIEKETVQSIYYLKMNAYDHNDGIQEI